MRFERVILLAQTGRKPSAVAAPAGRIFEKQRHPDCFLPVAAAHRQQHQQDGLRLGHAADFERERAGLLAGFVERSSSAASV